MVGNTSTVNKDKPFIFREEGSATRLAMDRYLKLEDQRKRIELTSNEAVKQAVMAGLGYSLIPLIGIKNELLNKELHIIPSKSLPIITEWRLIWLRNKKLSPVSMAFLNYIREEKKNIISKNFQWYLKFDFQTMPN
jgi:DNA-binding transcriptional LysR family regulator